MSRPTFSLGIRYWPRRRRGATGMLGTWSDADHGALRAELSHIAELGFDTVCFELRWAEAQPVARIDTAALRGLERALDEAHDQGLRAVVTTLAASFGGALHLPEWAVGYRLPGDLLRARRFGPPVPSAGDGYPLILAADRYRAEPVRDLYAEPEILAAQRSLLREVVGNLAAHPAATAWLLGSDVERVRRAATNRAAANWWADLVGYARDLGARTLLGIIGAETLLRTNTLRPDQIVRQGAHVVVAAPPLPPLMPSRGSEVRMARLLHALAVALIRGEAVQPHPVIVADLGIPTVAGAAQGVVESQIFGRPLSLLLADEETQATLVEQALATFQREGAAALWLTRYADLAPEFWRLPPADRSWWARTSGIVTADGREKPAAAAVRSFGARLRAQQLPDPLSVPVLALDPERYWRDPVASFRNLWMEWQ